MIEGSGRRFRTLRPSSYPFQRRVRMNKSDFHYDLPVELIAQTPIEHREHSRLLCLDRHTGEISHRRFFMLPEFLREGDCLVLNDSRVLPARLLGRTETGAVAEVLLLREVTYERNGEAQSAVPSQKYNTKPSEAQSATTWITIVRPGRKIKTGTKLIFGNDELNALVTDITEDGNRIVKFDCDGDFMETLERLGKTPLPPYIQKELQDSERYQTVYSRETGSAAAPTAGLHFTNRLIDEIKARGVEVCFITLHVGLGTFRPVKTDIIEEHKMHSEYFIIPEETADTVNRTKAGGGRVIAVGTTSCRTLESCSDESGTIAAYSGSTDIFIYPGYKFKCIDGLITNFHLPESTLIMLVCAFAGKENTRNAYEEAIREKYRFYSFGDCMLIL